MSVFTAWMLFSPIYGCGNKSCGHSRSPIYCVIELKLNPVPSDSRVALRHGLPELDTTTSSFLHGRFTEAGPVFHSAFEHFQLKFSELGCYPGEFEA